MLLFTPVTLKGLCPDCGSNVSSRIIGIKLLYFCLTDAYSGLPGVGKTRSFLPQSSLKYGPYIS